ncbi:MAG: MASE1 domain-containing protein [Gammaproteobacteria bacterium]|nr:MASE1 domain-containing protein [Gammaproteobacteria bacterium]
MTGSAHAVSRTRQHQLTLAVAWLSRFTSVAGDISLIWPVTGLSVAVALLWGRLATLSVGLGMIGWAWLQGLAPGTWPLLFAEACLPGLLAWYWPGRWTLSNHRALSNLSNLYLRGLLPGATSAALFGSLAIVTSGDFADFHWPDIAAFYWIASAIGVLLFTPLLIAVRQQGLRIQSDDWRFLRQWLACLLPVLLIAFLASPEYRWIANYLLVPMLVWASTHALAVACMRQHWKSLCLRLSPLCSAFISSWIVAPFALSTPICCCAPAWC